MSERYKYHPAYQEGVYAYVDGERRGRNPYSPSGDNQFAMLAWWAGWDSAAELDASQNEEIEDEVNEDGLSDEDWHAMHGRYLNQDE